MLSTKQNVLRRFWYAVIPMEDLKSGPKPFRLLGEDIVLFLDAQGKPAALKDRCCHRTSKLSKGWCNEGKLVCGYHGWTYDRTGKLVHVPQFPVQQEIPNLSTPAYHCETRYGYAWVALDRPLAPILDAAEENDPKYRRIPQFYEVWSTSALRLMENSFDNAHFAFVHKGTLGNPISLYRKNTRSTKPITASRRRRWSQSADPPRAATASPGPRAHHQTAHAQQMVHAVCRKLDIEYPSGLQPHHLQFGNADRRRSHSGRAVALPQRHRSRLPGKRTDRLGLQDHARRQGHDKSTDPDTPVDLSRRIEAHMVSDRPGMIMRRRPDEASGRERRDGGVCAAQRRHARLGHCGRIADPMRRSGRCERNEHRRSHQGATGTRAYQANGVGRRPARVAAACRYFQILPWRYDGARRR